MIDIPSLLNNEQLEAAMHVNGPLLVLAGAGSGKTRVVTYRIIHLLQSGIPASSILAVTFTNKAAREMEERVRHLTSAHVTLSTFHSLGAKLLRELTPFIDRSPGFVIYDEDDANRLLKNCLKELEISEKELPVKNAKSLISKAKNAIYSPDELPLEMIPRSIAPFFARLYSLYQQQLKISNAIDFDDLLYLPVRLFREQPQVLAHYQNRWQYLLVDEYQDTNPAQYELIQQLAAPRYNLFVVGDPDQSIYSWRGADLNNILRFEQDFKGAKVVRLEENYRSHQTILAGANGLISRNEQRYKKSLWSRGPVGEKIQLVYCNSDREESQFAVQTIQHLKRKGISYSDQVVFYRTNSQSRSFEDALLRAQVPYTIVGGISFYQRREIKDILGYLRMACTPHDIISFSRTLNTPKRGIGDKSMEDLLSAARQKELSILDYCRKGIHGEDKDIKFSPRQRQGIGDYIKVINAIQNAGSLQNAVRAAIELSGYLGFLESEPETKQDREANLYELAYKASEWEKETEEPTLEKFLEELSLRSSLDEADTETERVSLMTIHNGKGLEFKAAFVVGMEETLFPHINSQDDPNAVEEERRLCYVGMTRAKEFLYLSYAGQRPLWGSIRAMRPSRFLREIPPETLRHTRF